VAIRDFHDSSNTAMIRSPWPCSPPLSTGSDINRRPPSPVSPSTPHPLFEEIGTAIAHLRDVLGDQTYESLARKGETMTPPPWRRTHMTKSARPEQN
jgi:hypothetical protein